MKVNTKRHVITRIQIRSIYGPLSLLLIMIGMMACQTESAVSNRPNIVFILADDLGYADVSCYGGKIPTPNLDKIANSGMIFTDAHTTSSVCTPSRYGLLTGRYNWRSSLKQGVLFGYDSALLLPNRKTVASVLKDNGYHTAFIGKWHLGWNWAKTSEGLVDFSRPVTQGPRDYGFDYSLGIIASLDMPPYVHVENSYATTHTFDTTENNSKYSWWRKGITGSDFSHLDVTPRYFKESISYIDSIGKQKVPFFLYLALPSPHTPILPDSAWIGKSKMNPYADFVVMIDSYIGDIIKKLEELDIEDNTLFIFSSDNGCSPQADFEVLEQFGHRPNGIFRGHKADIYEGGHRVPFIAKWPGKIKPGTSSDETISLVDFMATCAAIVNYQLQDNEGEDSYSLLPLLLGNNKNSPLREATVHHSGDGDFAIRSGNWKLIMNGGSGGWSYPTKKDLEEQLQLPAIQLYNLKADPKEQNNVYDKNQEVVDRLKELLTKYINEGRSTFGSKQQNDGDKIWKQLWWMQ